MNVDIDKIHKLGKSTLTIVLFTDSKRIYNINFNKEISTNEGLIIG